MSSEQSSVTTPPEWLVEWMHGAKRSGQRKSIVLGGQCSENINQVATDVAVYLNEYDGSGSSQWRAFAIEELRSLAKDPTCCRLIAENPEPTSCDADLPTLLQLELVAFQLAKLGSVILEGSYEFDPAPELKNTFRVCICSSGTRDGRSPHLWIDPARVDHQALVSIIADSFLNWSTGESQGNEERLPAGQESTA